MARSTIRSEDCGRGALRTIIIWILLLRTLHPECSRARTVRQYAGSDNWHSVGRPYYPMQWPEPIGSRSPFWKVTSRGRRTTNVKGAPRVHRAVSFRRAAGISDVDKANARAHRRQTLLILFLTLPRCPLYRRNDFNRSVLFPLEQRPW